MRKRARAASVPEDVLNQLASYLDTGRETGRCQQPLPSSELERLAGGSSDAGASARAWTHLRGCVYCLNAYAQLHAAASSLLEVSGTSMAVAAPAAAAAPDRFDTAALDALRRRLAELGGEIQRTIKSWRHRAVQRSWSDPAYEAASSLGLMAPLADYLPAESPRPDILLTLDRLQRRAEEELEEILAVKRLAATSEQLRQDIRDARLPDDVRHELISELDVQYHRIVSVLTGAAARVRRR